MDSGVFDAVFPAHAGMSRPTVSLSIGVEKGPRLGMQKGPL